ncbi:MAG: LD-carboxypeptidase [Firmicutes bacterium]|nr:LD-carboxypeptidase [Bacillota bacterium]
MLKPKRLKRGATIGVIAPSSCDDIRKTHLAEKFLINEGFKVKMGKSCYESYGYLAGSDQIRAKDINDMFKDDEVDGIICLRGGYGSVRIIDLIDYEIIKNNPKVFLGYSDITALHIAINQLSDLITFHGPMLSSDMIKDFKRYSYDYLFDNLLKEGRNKLENPKDEKIKCLVKGRAKGKITGGNLALVTSTIGTEYEIDTKGKILMLEDIDEQPYRIDRMLNKLRLSGKLKDAAGIILGDFNNCIPNKRENSLTLMEVINDIIKPLNIPTVYNVKFGHCNPTMTIPLGIEIEMDSEKGNLVINSIPTFKK